MSSVKGAKGLERKLNMLDKKESRKIVRKAAREAHKIALKQGRALAKSMIGGETGNEIAKALKLRTLKTKDKSSYTVTFNIDPNRAEDFTYYSQDGKRTFIPAAIEYGHSGNTGSNKKVAKPIPYLRKASEQTKKPRIKKFGSVVKSELNAISKVRFQK